MPDNLPEATVFGKDQLLERIPAGLPSDLLERRPDILAAENALRAANANIVLRARHFSQYFITGLLVLPALNWAAFSGSNPLLGICAANTGTYF